MDLIGFVALVGFAERTVLVVWVVFGVDGEHFGSGDEIERFRDAEDGDLKKRCEFGIE